MKPKATFTKKDCIAVLVCGVFLLANIGAIGNEGRKRAKEVLCRSNLRQWGTIFKMYANDNDGYFPSFVGYVGDDDISRGSYSWHRMPGTSGTEKLRLCPIATKSVGEIGPGSFSAWDARCDYTGGTCWTPGPGDEGREESYYLGSYGLNAWCSNPLDEIRSSTWGHLHKYHWRGPNVKGADNIPLLLDAQYSFAWPYHSNQPPEFDGKLSWTNMGTFCLNRHNGGINGVFLDFSVRKIGLKELWKLKWHRAFDVNGPYTTAGGMMPDQWPEWMSDFKDF